jgi:Spy/CpxP family protein refolding chaperone
MKAVFKVFVLGVIACASVAVLAGAASAQDSAQQGKAQHAHRHGARTPFMGALRQLGLTADQQQSIHSLLDQQKQQHRSAAQTSRPNLAVLMNPGDPNYAVALQNAKTLAANHIQEQSDLQVKIYNLLTPDQQAKLAQVIADHQTKVQQHRQDWRQQHSVPAQS